MRTVRPRPLYFVPTRATPMPSTAPRDPIDRIPSWLLAVAALATVALGAWVWLRHPWSS